MLIVFFSSRISPFASTVIFFDRSPLATAVVTFAMFRTWAVRLRASTLTLSVRSFQVPATPGNFRLRAELSFDADGARHVGNLLGEQRELSVMPLIVSASAAISPLRVDDQLLRQVAVGDRGR